MSKSVDPYPPALRRVLKKTQSKEKAKDPIISRYSRRQKLMEEVWSFFNLAPQDWRGLAHALLKRHVPAFQEDRRGRPRKKVVVSDEEWTLFWDAGGSGFDEDVEAFIQASLVLAVELAALTKGREAAYRHLYNSPGELPTRYQATRSPAVLKQTYLRIPVEIRSSPKAFLPGTPEYAAYRP